MSDLLMWIVVSLFFFIPVAVVFVLFPIGMYNVAWRAFGPGAKVLPVYVPVSNGVQYFRLKGWTTWAYGALCLGHGLSAHLFALSFAVGFCPACTASPFQRVTGWIWIAAWAPLIVSKWWLPTGNAPPIHQPDPGDRLLFWDRIGRGLVRLVRPNRSRSGRGADESH